MNTEKRPVLCTTLYRKPMQPCKFDGILYQLRHWIFSHGFHQKIRFKRNFKKRPKVSFVKSPISSHSDALRSICLLFPSVRTVLMRPKEAKTARRVCSTNDSMQKVCTPSNFKRQNFLLLLSFLLHTTPNGQILVWRVKIMDHRKEEKERIEEENRS